MGERKPLVSVIIPCYNAERTLKAAVDSALAQCRDVPLEIILIDDGCTDGSRRVMESCERTACEGTGDERPTRVLVIRNEKSKGAAAGRNAGVQAARGKYAAFLDADDMWTEGKLKAQVALLEEAQSAGELCPLCCTARELITSDGKDTGRVIPVRQRISYRQLLSHNSINCSSVLLPIGIAREFPMEHEDSHEDYITWLKVLKKYGSAAGINRPYLKYRLSAGGKSGSKLKSARMTYTAYRYAGFGRIRAALLFVSYALHGVWKYVRA